MSFRLKFANWIAGGALAAAPATPALPAVENSAVVPLSSLRSLNELIGDGVNLDYVSAERAMRHSAVYACGRIIAGTIAQLPFKVYKPGAGGVPVEASEHPLAQLLRLRPNPEMSASTFWRNLELNAILRGNGYAWIERNLNGQALALWPIAEAHCWPYRSKTYGVVYQITLADGRRVNAPAIDMLHIPGSLEWDGLRAKSPLAAAAAAVNIGLDADEFAARHLINDATPPGVLEYSGKVSPDTANLIRQEWQGMGTGEHRGKIRVVSEGGVYKPISIKPEESQILETRRFQIEDIARIFGVPPHMIGAIDKTTSWGSGVEQQSIGFVQYTLGMHIKAIEQELEWKLFGDDGHFAEVDVRALMRGDFKTRNDGYRAAVGGSAGAGWMTINEVRALENLPPVEGGDKLVQWTQNGAAPK